MLLHNTTRGCVGKQVGNHHKLLVSFAVLSKRPNTILEPHPICVYKGANEIHLSQACNHEQALSMHNLIIFSEG